MSDKAGQPARKGSQRAAKARGQTGRQPQDGTAPAPPPRRPRYRVAASKAVEVATKTPGTSAPVRVTPVYSLESGLADYGMWVEMFTQLTTPPPGESFRRGRVWA